MSDLAVSPDLVRSVLPQVPGGADAARLRQVAEDFEATFLSQMLQPMFAGLSTEAPFGGGAGEQTWRSFMVDAMARRVASGGGIGLADHVQRELIAMQGGAARAPQETV